MLLICKNCGNSKEVSEQDINGMTVREWWEMSQRLCKDCRKLPGRLVPLDEFMRRFDASIVDEYPL